MYLADVMRGTVRELRRIVRAEYADHGRLRDHFVAVGAITVIVDLVCAALAFLFERDAAHTQVTSLGTALFWTSTQLLTVSSSIQNPLTTPGRILDVFMEGLRGDRRRHAGGQHGVLHGQARARARAGRRATRARVAAAHGATGRRVAV